MENILSFSGGKDSMALLLKLIEVRYELEKELGFPISKFKVHQDMLKKRLKERGLI